MKKIVGEKQEKDKQLKTFPAISMDKKPQLVNKGEWGKLIKNHSPTCQEYIFNTTCEN